MKRLCLVVTLMAACIGLWGMNDKAVGRQPTVVDEIRKEQFGEKIPSTPGCKKVSCKEAGAWCGDISDGCGKVLHCGIATSVTVTVTPTSYSGVCPKAFTFTGTITTSQAGTAVYFWRNHPLIFEEGQLSFSGPGTKQVSYTWHVGANLPPDKQWLKFSACGAAEIPPASFTAQCTALKPKETNP